MSMQVNQHIVVSICIIKMQMLYCALEKTRKSHVWSDDDSGMFSSSQGPLSGKWNIVPRVMAEDDSTMTGRIR